MFLSSLLSLSYWNSLTNSYMGELVLVLTVAVVIILEHRFGPKVHHHIPSRYPLLRGLIFLCLCAIAALAVAWALRFALGLFSGQYLCIVALLLILLVAYFSKR